MIDLTALRSMLYYHQRGHAAGHGAYIGKAVLLCCTTGADTPVEAGRAESTTLFN